MSAVKNLRKASMVLNFSNDHNRSPGLASKVGSVCSYFYAPNATPGRGAAFSPAGKHILRYGYGPDIKVLNATDASVAVTLSHPVGAYVNSEHAAQFYSAHELTDDSSVNRQRTDV